MKFVVSGEEMNSAIKRAVSVVPKKYYFPACVMLEAAGESVDVCVILQTKTVTIRVPAYVIEPGKVAVADDEIALVCGLNGDVTYESDEKALSAHNQKKRRSVMLRDLSKVRPWLAHKPYQPFGSIGAKELMDAFKATDNSRSYDDNRKVLTTFCLNRREMVALDGFTFVLRKLHFQNAENDENLLLEADVYTDLKNLILSKKNGDVSIQFCDACVCIAADDFTYESRLVEGDYIKYEQIIPKQAVFTAEVDAKELSGIVGEYVKYNAVNRTHAMCIQLGSGIMTTALATESGYLGDKVESCKLSGGEDKPLFNIAFNIQYVKNGLAAMDKDDIQIRFTSHVSPMVLSTENTTAMVLPLRINGASEKFNVDGMLEFIRPMREALQIPA